MIEKSSLERLELLGRLSSITEELESIAKNAGKPEKPTLRAASPLSGRDAAGAAKDALSGRVFYEACRHVVLKNLLVGRCAVDCYVVGKAMGLSFSVKGHKQLIKISRSLGIEPVSVKEIGDPQEHRIFVDLKKGLTASFVEAAKHPICYFEAGLLSGLMERVTKRRVDLQEVICAATGGKNCRFVSSQVSIEPKNPQKARKGALPLFSMGQYSEENVRLLTTLAAHALTAIENTLLFEKTKRQAVIDGLTGIYNHRYFQQALRVELKRAERHNQPLSILMMDVDFFKRINDVCGHPKGDRVLKMMGRILTALVRDIDIVARYGGDEFAIVLPQTDAAGASVVAKRILGWCEKTHFLQHQGKPLRVSVSIGIATRSKTVHDSSLLIEAADRVLRQAKKKGRGQMALRKE